MNENLKDLFSPSNSLYESIICRIDKERSLTKLKNRLIISSVVFLVSITCFLLSIIFFMNSASSTGFAQVFSLIFSDFYIISSYSKDFMLSLLENLPIYNIILSLFMTLFVVFVARLLTKDIKNFVFYSHIK